MNPFLGEHLHNGWFTRVCLSTRKEMVFRYKCNSIKDRKPLIIYRFDTRFTIGTHRIALLIHSTMYVVVSFIKLFLY